MYKIVLDTETCQDIDNALTYDIGWSVVNVITGEVEKTYSFVVSEIFLNKELMESAFFKDKIPQYEKDLQNGTRKLATLNTIRKELIRTQKRYSTKEIACHNALFDYRALQRTQRYLTKSKYRFFFSYGTIFIDTLKMSREILGKDDNYLAFCNENNYLTKNNKPRFTAEIITRYLTNNNDFLEEHCGLEDTLIEKDILLYCLEKDSNVNGWLWEN